MAKTSALMAGRWERSSEATMSADFFQFQPFNLPPEAEALRADVRDFVARELKDRPLSELGQTWSGSDPEFSRKMGEKGWIGMIWPKRYGGHERSSFERYVVLEEMLAADAPVGAHWVADRQSGPLLLRFGTEEQRQEHLPAIARGERFFCIGMSEPNSGSDLASVRTKAERVAGGYKVNGRKIWTSGAHRAHFMIATLRTQSDPEDRHGGLTQFLVDLKTPGIHISPIEDLSRRSHFNEVLFEDVFLPETARVGNEGDGWMQVTSELAFERSGPERFLSCYPLFRELIREIGPEGDRLQRIAIGRLTAHLVTLRRMSISVAGMLNEGANPALEASVVKDQGAIYEQSLPNIARALVDLAPTVDGQSPYQEILGTLLQAVPSFSLRGGTREILRGIIARGLGLR